MLDVEGETFFEFGAAKRLFSDVLFGGSGNVKSRFCESEVLLYGEDDGVCSVADDVVLGDGKYVKYCDFLPGLLGLVLQLVANLMFDPTCLIIEAV